MLSLIELKVKELKSKAKVLRQVKEELRSELDEIREAMRRELAAVVVHLNKQGVNVLAKTLKDTALGQNNHYQKKRGYARHSSPQELPTSEITATDDTYWTYLKNICSQSTQAR
ncbi:hypothetical protein AAFF_G00310430 [Aldrovandia affinis]|uniref:Uncharacterized protein n=1 Tax=Aldrovandia affinis TaxID=143900 RepID=A0AAD7RAB3_9TELE|nr:hypothetical protein AAFF_G00310430 [Aldrovandia affinis]